MGQQIRSARDEEQVRERSRERYDDSLGLYVVHESDAALSIDLICVHGLGGTCRKTWTRDRDTRLFWSQEWLSHEHGFRTVRILIFGYNAHFAAIGRENILNINNFAKDLLFGMKYALNQNAEELYIGKVSDSSGSSDAPTSRNANAKRLSYVESGLLVGVYK